MKKQKKRLKSIATKHFKKICLTTSLAVLSACQLEAVEFSLMGTNMPAVDFHAFGSQGYIINTGHNDYLGGDSSSGSYDFREYGINASVSKGKWRVGAQAFGQKLGQYGEDKMKLDWGIVDYQAFQWFGLRAGRVKMPRGLYNEALDLDSTRPFVLLPQSIYDARLRDFNSAFNGGMGYGNIDMGKVGSLDYKVFGGLMPIDMSSGAVDYFNTSYVSPTYGMSVDHVIGASLFWNTPVSGLRVGYSVNNLAGLNISRSFMSGTNKLFYTKTSDDDLFLRQIASAEYTWGKWTFATEAGLSQTKYMLTGGLNTSYKYDGFDVYVSAARRMNKWLELGGYFSHSNERAQSLTSLNQGDWALSAKIDFTDYIYMKVEAHYMDDSGKIYSTSQYPQPYASRDKSWGLFTAKVGFSF